MNQSQQQGYDAFWNEDEIQDNPYQQGSVEYSWWFEGFGIAAEENVTPENEVY